jgi:hypothetical protein
MPTVLQKNGYRFHFYSHEASEPPHVHVENGGKEAKFWLRPIRLADNDGFSAHELRKIVALLEEHWLYLEKRYIEFHGIRARHRRQESGN